MVKPIVRYAGEGVRAGLRRWFACPPGDHVAGVERALLRRVLSDMFGYHIIQLGNHYAGSVIEASRIGHQVVLGTDGDEAEGSAVLCQSDALPLDSASVDVIVIPHILEFSANPHGVLREADRVLIGEGHIVVLGFNPWSLCGIGRLILGWRGVAPWCGRFFGVARLKDWLGLLGFEIESVAKASYLPPSSRGGLDRRLAFLDQLGASCWPFFGNIYVVAARKRVMAATPLKASWKDRRRLVAGSVVEPTTRCGETGGPGFKG